jgi:hypothetical protein
VAPGISFLQVPEAKTVKNYLHLDIPARRRSTPPV